MFFFSFLLLTTVVVSLTPFPTNPRNVAKPQLIEYTLQNLQRGVRFAPHPEELIYDLIEKNKNHEHTILTMPEVNMNEVEPWDVISMTKEGEDCYLLWKQDKRYETGSRICRTSKRGYWKSTGNDTAIYGHQETGTKIIGMKKNLVFYLGKASSGKNTKWVMKEFRVESSSYPDLPAKNPWVVVLITYSGENNGQERMDPTVVRGLIVDAIPMEPSGRIAFTSPAPTEGASGSSVSHSDIALVQPLIYASDSPEIPKEALKVTADIDAPNYAYELLMRMDSQTEQPPLKKIKTMTCLPEATIINDSPTSVLVTGSHFSSREIMHDSDQFSTCDITAYYNLYFNEAPPNLEDFRLPGPTINK